MRLIVTDESQQQVTRDQHLIAHIAKVHQWLALLTTGKVTSINDIASSENVDPSHVPRMLHRAFLASDIVSQWHTAQTFQSEVFKEIVHTSG